MRGADGLENGRIWDLNPEPEEPYIEDETEQGCETCYNWPECTEKMFPHCSDYDYIKPKAN